MKTHHLIICGNMLVISVGDRPHASGPGESRPTAGGEIEQGLPLETCPSCGQAECVNECDGSPWAGENNDETEEDAIDRQRYNAFVAAIESIALAHACAGVNIGDPNYVEGLNTALEAAGNNL